MNQYLNETFGRYQHAGILIDTNILLLYFIGLCSRQQIPEFKRTKQFTIEDDFRLSQYLSSIQVDAINFNHIRAYNWS